MLMKNNNKNNNNNNKINLHILLQTTFYFILHIHHTEVYLALWDFSSIQTGVVWCY